LLWGGGGSLLETRGEGASKIPEVKGSELSRERKRGRKIHEELLLKGDDNKGVVFLWVDLWEIRLKELSEI